MKVDRVEGKSFAASIGGSGNIDLAALTVEEAAFAIGGSGNIKAAGTARSSSASIGGSGDLDLGALETRQSKVSIAGSGNVTARATEAADIQIVGSGDDGRRRQVHDQQDGLRLGQLHRLSRYLSLTIIGHGLSS
jgi:hypothetical protein